MPNKVSSSMVDYLQSATATTRSLESRLQDSVSVLDYGADPTGVADSTAAIQAAVEAANGRTVLVPPGHYVITTELSDSLTVSEVRLKGTTPINYNHTHLVDTNSTTFAIDTTVLDAWVEQYAVFKCDGCNFFGASDGVSTFNASNKLKQCEGIVAYGVNGAEMGLHVIPQSMKVKDCFFARFEQFGMCTRGGSISEFTDLGFDSNGWNLAETGTPAVGDYGSGCNIKIGANNAAQAYHTVNSSNRPTTFAFRNIWCMASDYYVNTSGTVYSGQRAYQIHGLISGDLHNVGGYQGGFINVSRCVISGSHLENYARHGLTNADYRPRCLYTYNAEISRVGNYNANFAHDWTAARVYPLSADVVPTTANGFYYECTTAGTAGGSEPTWPLFLGDTVADNTAVWTCKGQTAGGPPEIESLASGSTRSAVGNFDGVIDSGTRIENAKVINRQMIRATELQREITTTASGGGTSTHTFPNVLEKDPTSHSTKGFHGIVSVSVVHKGNFNNYGNALFYTTALWAGAALKESATQLHTSNSPGGTASIDPSDLTWDTNGGLTLQVTWGTAWNNDVHQINISLIGGAQQSSH